MQQPWKGLKEGLGGGPRGISVEWGRHEPRARRTVAHESIRPL